jgi:hypothetical protein
LTVGEFSDVGAKEDWAIGFDHFYGDGFHGFAGGVDVCDSIALRD